MRKLQKKEIVTSKKRLTRDMIKKDKTQSENERERMKQSVLNGV